MRIISPTPLRVVTLVKRIVLILRRIDLQHSASSAHGSISGCVHVSAQSAWVYARVPAFWRREAGPCARRWPEAGHGARHGRAPTSHAAARAAASSLRLPWLMFCVLLPSNGSWLTQSLGPRCLWWLAETKRRAGLPNQEEKNLQVPRGFGHGLQYGFLLHFTSLSAMFKQKKKW